MTRIKKNRRDFIKLSALGLGSAAFGMAVYCFFRQQRADYRLSR